MTVFTVPHQGGRGVRRVSTACAVVISIGAACTAHTPGAASVPPPASQQPAPTQLTPLVAEPLYLTVQVRVIRAGITLGVERGDTLKTGDFLELYVRLNQPAYLYVLQLLPGGKPSMLFPQHGDRELTAGTAHRIPETTNQLLQVDPHDRTEDIYVVMSRAPVTSASSLFLALAPQPERHAVSTPKPPKPLRSDVLFDTATRHVILVNRPDHGPTLIDARDPSQGTFVFQLSFKHT